jgi:hypothetical protein
MNMEWHIAAQAHINTSNMHLVKSNVAKLHPLFFSLLHLRRLGERKALKRKQ